jgi:hypothetical protein
MQLPLPLQVPEQHSLPTVQAWPLMMQHLPAGQARPPEQQSKLVSHSPPSGIQVHWLPLQVPEQQSALFWQSALFGWQHFCCALQRGSTTVPYMTTQQSLLVVQVAAGGLQQVSD